MLVRTATPNDVSLIFSFIQKKAEFDRNIGAFSGVLRVSEAKIRKTLFSTVPFAYVLFAETLGHPRGKTWSKLVSLRRAPLRNLFF